MSDETDAPTTPTTTKATVTRTEFAAHLIDLDKGRIHDDATDRLAELVAAVAHTGQKGSMSITITVEAQDPATFEDTGVLLLTGDVAAKLPRLKRAPSIFFATGVNGQITRDDPERNDPRD